MTLSAMSPAAIPAGLAARDTALALRSVLYTSFRGGHEPGIAQRGGRE